MVKNNLETLELVLQTPELEDAAKIHQLICRSKPLDPNSVYLYLLLAHFFDKTCAVLKVGDDVVGAVTGFVVPERPDTLFIWQVVVDSAFRGKGMARLMVDYLLKQKSCEAVRYLEATVSPSNSSSKKLFEKIAMEHEAVLDETPLFVSKHFGAEEHEEENLIRIGPLNEKKRKDLSK